MKQQRYYIFIQKQILVMIGLSLLPGLVYVFFGWYFDILKPALVWYGFLLFLSSFGLYVYREFSVKNMDESELESWYEKLSWFMYGVFSSWTFIFVMYVGHDENNLHYIAIFTQLGAAVVASALLISDKKLFVPMLIVLMFPLVIYFALVGTWYGYVLAIFSLIFLGVLLYASFNTNTLLKTNYYQAQHDPLTGLYNRRYITEYMDSLNERLSGSNKNAVICLIDLDHFKTINDSLGHDIGDKLLVQVARRIEKFVQKSYVLARLGGDEFIVVSKTLHDTSKETQTTQKLAEGLLDKIRKPYIIDGHYLHVSASVGIHQINAKVGYNKNFIKEVDIAMYEAKNKGRDGVVIFNTELQKRVERHLIIEQNLYHALNNNKLKVNYQPQFNQDKKLVGCESLIRWNDDELGIVSPEEFIPIAEKTGLIMELGNYVIKETFKTINHWNGRGIKLQSFSINVSIRQLLHDTFIEDVIYLLADYLPRKAHKQTIYFEITEHVFAEDVDRVIGIMNRFKKIGIAFSIDDFGTGYSSLSYLKVLPIDEVKIDKSFINDIAKQDRDQQLINAIISIAKSFNLKIVAEGVETFDQLVFLNKLECDTYQGFYFEEALSKKTFEARYIFT